MPDDAGVEIPQVEMFTDGACVSNPGPGGYGVLYRAGNRLQFDGSSGLPSIEHYSLGCSNKPEYHLEFIVEWG